MSEIDRRLFAQLGVAAAATLVARKAIAYAPHADPLDETTFARLAAQLKAGKTSAKLLAAQYLQRIEASNERGPQLRAVLETNPEADELATVLDVERSAGKVRGPLHGIPILVKDNLDTGDRMQTTAGSLALAGTHAKQDSTVVAKLRAAGAVILGKTNLSEWANIRGAPSTSGWSARGGQCRNPYALDRNPSGSSSGSAVAVSANLCPAAIGTETDGSIVSPASICGLVGLKPTVGLVSRAGIIPISSSQDTAGPMCRTVTDAAVLLAAIAGPDPRDPATKDAKVADYASALTPEALKGARIGVPRKGWFGVNRYMDEMMTSALAILKRLGAVLVDIELEQSPELGPAEQTVLLTELKAGLAAYLATRGADTKVRTLADVIAFDKAHAKDELARFGQELFELAQTKGPLTDKAYLDARALCLRLARDPLDRAFAKDRLDAICACTGSPAWLIDPIDGDAAGASASTLPAVAGYPHLTVPAGQTHGLPLGLSFFGRPYSERELLGYGYAFERATHARVPPTFRPTAG
ncbi:MAG TPA: amidase [Kofleriaceae bacterium]|jgi:amidase